VEKKLPSRVRGLSKTLRERERESTERAERAERERKRERERERERDFVRFFSLLPKFMQTWGHWLLFIVMEAVCLPSVHSLFFLGPGKKLCTEGAVCWR